MSKNGWQQDKCEYLVDELYKCCTAWYEKNRTSIGSELHMCMHRSHVEIEADLCVANSEVQPRACPTRDLLEKKVAQRKDEKETLR